MKFVHIADVHFDSPFTSLLARGLSKTRHLEQRNAFKKVIDYIREENIPYLFICGDLYEHEYVKLSTIEYINGLFKTIPNTKIFITPGNHDPYIKNSYYMTYNFANNVKIFNQEIQKINEGDICIYGYGFDDFYMDGKQGEKLYIEDKTKINILLSHADLDGLDSQGIMYNPILKSYLKEKGFDYVALGHIHKSMYDKNIVYPGSLISLGFDELGKHRNDCPEKLMKLQKKFV